MAKKKSGISGSQHIRDHLESDPAATPNEIVAALAKKGIKVSPGLAANVKYAGGPGARKKSAKKKRAAGRKKGTKRTVKRKRPGAQMADMATLKAAARFVAEVEDADEALAAVRQLQSLQID